MQANKFVSNLLQVSMLLSTVILLAACGGGGSGGVVTDVLALPAARGSLPQLARSSANFEGVHHAGSGACASCHTDDSMVIKTPVPGVTRNVSIGTAWETSVMANSTRDPYWHAVVASELDNFPQLEDEINDKCTVCHAPLAHDLARKEGLDLRLFDKLADDGTVLQQGLYSMNETSELFNHAMDGVSCSLCHQMEDVNLGSDEGMSGGFVITGSPTGDPADRPAYGQYTDPDVGYMRQQVGYLAQYGAHVSTSESCATCHNLNVAPVDEAGNALTEVEHFAEQAIFTEWLNSDYAIGGPKQASCQDCHMPKVEEAVYLGQGAPEKRNEFSEHTFLGPNTVMLDMFKNFSAELGIDPNLDFEPAILRNREFIKTSAEVTLVPGGVTEQALSSGETGETGTMYRLDFDVDIENRTGHRLPSGYHSRRVYLHVQVLDSSGQLLFESGRIRPDGSIVGVSEDVNPDTWEQHYDVISSEAQVQVYQAIVGNSDGERTHSLLAGTHYLKDNRLTPSGMDRFVIQNDTTLPDSFGTFGKALEDPDFNLGRDIVTYQVTVPGPGLYTVSAELRYQPISYGHLQKLWTQGDRVEPIDMFRTLYDATELRDEVIDTAVEIMQ